MGRYYFHLKDGDEMIPDEDGTELQDVAAATREALRSARELLADAIKAGKPKIYDAFVIADEAGRTVEVLPFAALLPEPLKK
jgi:hypothetical protein